MTASFQNIKEIIGLTFALVTRSKANLAILAALLGFFGLDSIFFRTIAIQYRLTPIAGIAVFYLISGYFQWRHANISLTGKPSKTGTKFFRYLRPFDEKSAKTFFGREDKIAESIDLILAPGFRAGVLVGESGTGKTSLIRAGLIPKIQEHNVDVRYIDLVSESDSIDANFAYNLSSENDPSEPTTLVIFDQTEVWFTQTNHKQGILSEAKKVIEYLRSLSHTKILMVVRKEFFLDLVRAIEPILYSIVHPNNRIDLLPFDEAKAKRILGLVASRFNIHVENALVETMLEELDRGGILPAELQVVCSMLHEGRHELTLSAYHTLGGKEGILKRFLEERILLRYPTRIQDTVKSVLLSLIQNGEKQALSIQRIQQETGVFLEEIAFVVRGLERDGVLVIHRGHYRLVHAYFIPAIIRWSGAFKGTAQHARTLLEERMSIWKTDNQAIIPADDLRIIRRHWHSSQLDDLREEANRLFQRSTRAWMIRIATLVAACIIVVSLLFYFSYPYIRYQMLADKQFGRLLVKTSSNNITIEFFRIHAETGELTPVTMTANEEIDLPHGSYYLKAHMNDAVTVYKRYPVILETIRHISDVKRILLDDSILSKHNLDLDDMIYIEGGWFLMGNDSGRDDEQPGHQVKLSPFYIDKFAVTNKEYREFLEWMDVTKDHSLCHDQEAQGKDHHPTPWYGRQPHDYYTNPVYDNYPVTNLDWFDAYSYAAWAGKRLPTEAEWERAAAGTTNRRYPWGNGPVNNNGRYRANLFPDGGRLNDDDYLFTARVDTFHEGATPEGVFNLAGNVYEFCYDWYHGKYYSRSPREDPIGPGIQPEGKVVRGGSHEHGMDDLRSANRQISPSRWTYNWLGFRCVVTAAK